MLHSATDTVVQGKTKSFTPNSSDVKNRTARCLSRQPQVWRKVILRVRGLGPQSKLMITYEAHELVNTINREVPFEVHSNLNVIYSFLLGLRMLESIAPPFQSPLPCPVTVTSCCRMPRVTSTMPSPDWSWSPYTPSWIPTPCRRQPVLLG